MTTTSPDPADVVRTVLAAIDNSDLSVLDTAIAEDVNCRFGNADPTTTREGLAATAEAFLGSIAGIRHEILDLLQVDDTVVAQMDVHYERLNGARLTLPCCNVFRVRDGKVFDYRIYLDISPVYAS